MSDLTKTKVLTPSLHEDLILSDGSHWIQLVSHNVKLGINLFSSSDNFSSQVYHGSDFWCNFSIIDSVNRPNTNYEFLVLQQNDNTEIFTQYRWAQLHSPLTATWSQVSPSSGNITHYDGVTNYGGMYKFSSKVYMCFANASNGNWYGCASNTLWGGTAGVDGYTPGYNGARVYGIQNVYMRIDESKVRIGPNVLMANGIMEY